MTVVHGLSLLTLIYLGQGREVFGSSVDDSIRNFVRDESPDDIRASIDGLERLLASPMTEQEYYDRWVYGLRSSYDPRKDGYTYPEFFAHALDLLRTAAPSG